MGFKIIQGTSAELYNLLLKCSHVLNKANDGKITYLEQDGNDNFLYYFVTLKLNSGFYAVHQASDYYK